MPAVLVVVVVVAILLWLFMTYFPIASPAVKAGVFAVVYVLLVLWVLGVSIPPLFHGRG